MLLITDSLPFLSRFGSFFNKSYFLGSKLSSTVSFDFVYASDLLDNHRSTVLSRYLSFIAFALKKITLKRFFSPVSISGYPLCASASLFNGNNLYSTFPLNSALLRLAVYHHLNTTNERDFIFLFILNPYLYLSYFIFFRHSLHHSFFVCFHYIFALLSLLSVLFFSIISIFVHFFFGLATLFHFIVLNSRFILASPRLHNRNLSKSSSLLITYGSPLIESLPSLTNQHLGILPTLLLERNIQPDILFIDINKTFNKLFTPFDVFKNLRDDKRMSSISFSPLSLHGSISTVLQAFSLYIRSFFKGIISFPFYIFFALRSRLFLDLLMDNYLDMFFGSRLIRNILHCLFFRQFFCSNQYFSIIVATEGQGWEKFVYHIHENSTSYVISYPHLPIKRWDMRFLTHYNVVKLLEFTKPDYFLSNSPLNTSFFRSFFNNYCSFSEVESLRYNPLPSSPLAESSLEAVYDFLILGDYSISTTSHMFSTVFGLDPSHTLNIAYKPHPLHPYKPKQIPQNCCLTITNESISTISNLSRYVLVSSTSSVVVDCLLCNIKPLIFNTCAVNPSLLSSIDYPFFFSNSAELDELREYYQPSSVQSPTCLAYTSDDYIRWSNFFSSLLVFNR